MNEASILASLLKTQDTKLSEFLEKLAAQKINVDTTQLKQLITQYNNLLNNMANIQPNIDTTNVRATLLDAIDSAVSSSRLSDLKYEVTRQTEAVNKNSTLLQIGFGKMFKWWILCLVLLLGIFIGWAINWCFEIPQAMSKIYKYQKIQSAYDNINDAMGNDCVLAKRFYKNKGWTWRDNSCNYIDKSGNSIHTVPLKSSEEIINSD
jgi:hypothetical protein